MHSSVCMFRLRCVKPRTNLRGCDPRRWTRRASNCVSRSGTCTASCSLPLRRRTSQVAPSMCITPWSSTSRNSLLFTHTFRCLSSMQTSAWLSIATEFPPTDRYSMKDEPSEGLQTRQMYEHRFQETSISPTMHNAGPTDEAVATSTPRSCGSVTFNLAPLSTSAPSEMLCAARLKPSAAQRTSALAAQAVDTGLSSPHVRAQ